MIKALTTWSERYYRPDLVRRLYRDLRGYELLGLGAAGMTALLFSPPQLRFAHWVWLLSMAAFYLAMLFHLRAYGASLPLSDCARWIRRYTLYNGLIAAGWGMSAFLFLPDLGFWQGVALIFLIFSILATPLPVFSHYLPSSLLSTLLILVPTTSAYLIEAHDGRYHYSVATIFVVAGCLSIFKSLGLSRSEIEAVDARRELKSARAEIARATDNPEASAFTMLSGMTDAKALEQVAHRDFMAAKRPFFLLAASLDDFHDLAAAYGRELSLRILVTVARRLQQIVTPERLVAVTQEAGTFLILGSGDASGALFKETVGQLPSVVEAPIEGSDHELRLTGSVGVAQWPNDGEQFQDVAEMANLAMREARQSAGHSVRIHQADQKEQVRFRAKLRAQLARALASEEFSLHLQPKIDLFTGEVLGAEALLRWHSPVLGSVSPEHFIPFAESSGDIVEIGRWVIREAVRILRMPELPQQFSIAINISVEQFAAPSLAPDLETALSRLPRGRRLDIEITETVVMREPRAVEKILASLTRLGVHIALDDFGTGYSSLSYLNRLPIHEVKLDRSFLTKVPEDERQAALVASVINMSHALGLELVAEGVERREQSNWLRDQGCYLAQGYLYAKPMPVDEFLTWRTTERTA